MNTKYFVTLLACVPAVLLGGTLSLSSAETPMAVVFRVSEGIRPGETFSLYGEYLDGSCEVRFLAPDGSVLATQPAVQTDSDGRFLRAIFPDIDPGVYRLSVHNSAGWSEQGIYINNADPRWLSDDRAYPGMKLKLIGRNLDAAEFGGKTEYDEKTSTAIVFWGERRNVYNIEPDAVNPYCVDFTIPDDMVPGVYQVLVNVRCHTSACLSLLSNRSEYPEKIENTLQKMKVVKWEK